MTEPDILDTHLHLIDRTRLEYPWLGDVPDLNRDWPLADYARQARQSGIMGALHMEVDVAPDRIEDETTWIEELAEAADFPLFGVISACRPEEPGFEAFLERTAARQVVKGFRRVLHVMPDALSQTDSFRSNIRRMAGPDLPFDICMLARQLPLAIELADAAPNTRFVIDHCGVPDIAGDGWDQWAADMTALAKRENTCAKVSGIVAYAGPDWTLEDLSRWVDHVAAAFGTDRICWGGDWPVCTLGGGLQGWVAATRAITAGWSADERRKLYSTNAQRIWGL